MQLVGSSRPAAQDYIPIVALSVNHTPVGVNRVSIMAHPVNVSAPARKWRCGALEKRLERQSLNGGGGIDSDQRTNKTKGSNRPRLRCQNFHPDDPDDSDDPMTCRPDELISVTDQLISD